VRQLASMAGALGAGTQPARSLIGRLLRRGPAAA
jgi:hypothetical protein